VQATPLARCARSEVGALYEEQKVYCSHSYSTSNQPEEPTLPRRSPFIGTIHLALLILGVPLAYSKGVEPTDSSHAITIHSGESIRIDPSLVIKFESHSHKRMYAGTGKGPLIIFMTYTLNDSVFEKVQHNVMVAKTGEWDWREYRFRLIEVDYGTRMKLTVSKASQSEPPELSTFHSP
jgi:hypothetical protein